MTQVKKQAVQDFETKYEKRVRNIKVVSNLPNVDDYFSSSLEKVSCDSWI